MGIAWSQRAFDIRAGIESLDGDLGRAFIAESAGRGDFIDASHVRIVPEYERINLPEGCR